MENDIYGPEHHARKKPFILFSIIQWAVACFFCLIALALLIDLRKLGLPDAPVIMFWSTVAAMATLAVLHGPPVFFRLPRKGRLGAYAGILASFVLFGTYVQRMEPVWSKTPEGAQEMAERAAADTKAAAEAAERQKTAHLQADMERLKAELKETMTKLESCFSWGHRLSALEDPVKEALHNPAAFEHVKTELIMPDTADDNVEMTFRAENAFGAIRTATVRAQLVADSCEVQNIGEPQID